jgi:hypothetical protein
MKLYSDAKLVAVSREEFKDKETGEAIVYFVNVLKADGSILNANSKTDYSECEGKSGVAAIEVSVKQAKDGGFATLKFNLKDFFVGNEIGELESEVK